MAHNFYFQQMQMMVQPMRDELTRIGFKELRTPEEVVEALEGEGKNGTALIVVNSVCGCAAGLARPAVAKALTHEKKPDHLYTVFAGQDKEATAKAREYFEGEPPSSPSFALMKDGKLVEFGSREQILHSPNDPYTKRLLAAVPVPDPDEQRVRREERDRLLEAEAVALDRGAAS